MRRSRSTRTRISRGMRRAWAEKKARRFVYVAGPMTGLTADEARSWRRKTTNVLERAGFTVLDPTRRDKDMPPDEVYENGGMGDGERRFVHDADLRDVKMAHVVLLYLGGEQVSIGSLWEAGWCDVLGKPLVIATPHRAYKDHPFVAGCGARVVPTLEQAIKHIVRAYGKGERA